MNPVDYMTDEDLLVNPTARIPVCLCIDTSGSMLACEGGVDTGETVTRDGITYHVVSGGGPAVLDRVNDGLKLLYDALLASSYTKDAVDLAIVLFDDTARLYLPFTGISNLGEAPQIPLEEIHDSTVMSQGIRIAIDHLNDRKKSYKANAVDYFQPQIILITDGETNANDSIDAIQQEVRDLCAAKKLTFLPIDIESLTEEAREFLKAFGGKPPVHAEDIVGFFEWYSKSVASIGASNPGESVPVDVDGISKWGDW